MESRQSRAILDFVNLKNTENIFLPRVEMVGRKILTKLMSRQMELVTTKHYSLKGSMFAL